MRIYQHLQLKIDKVLEGITRQVDAKNVAAFSQGAKDIADNAKR